VVEAGGRRRKGQRILYYFRTPPAVRVGRDAIDPEAMRLLEQHNPDVSFDWGRLLRSGSPGSPGSSGSPGSGSPGSREERRRDRREHRRGRYEPPPVAAPSVIESAQPGEASAPERLELDDIVDRIESVEPLERVEPLEAGEPLEAFEPVEPLEPFEPVEPVEPRTTHLENLANPEPAEPGEPGEPEEPVPERYARLGADGLARLRARYADIALRLAARPMEDAERAELMGRVEGLNPDAWSTPDEVAAALEAYETVFESLRSVIGRHPRRRRL
jgi:hypothetical protein